MGKEINEKLYRAISQQTPDFNMVKELLKQGADPLGPLKDECETAIQLMFCDASWLDSDADNHVYTSEVMPRLMELFIEMGLDCSRFLPDVDGDHNLELWSLTFAISEGACKTLRLMIENGLKLEPIEDCICHFFFDCDNCDGSDIDEDYEEYLSWAVKMTLMCASYQHLLENSEYLRSVLEISSTNKDNTYPLKKFRNYEDYECRFDYSTMDNIPYGVRNATVEIVEKGSKKPVWKLHI